MIHLPEWLVDFFKQFPTVALVLVVLWYAERRITQKEIRLEGRVDDCLYRSNEREDKFRIEVRSDRDAEIQRAQEVYTKLIAAKDEQIAKLTKDLDGLTKQLTALTKKLMG